MGKHLQRKHSGVPFEKNQSGCLWGILQILDYHQWYNVKKMLPHKRHGGERHARGIRSLEMNLNAPDNGEGHECMHAEVDNFRIEEKMAEASPTNRKSGKACMKALIAEEMSKEEDRKRRIPAFPARSRLLRTDSIHHLEPSNLDLHWEVSTNGEIPRIDLHQNNANTSAISTWDPPLLKAPEEPVACSKRCEVRVTANTMNDLGHDQLDEPGRHLLEKHTLLRVKSDKAEKGWLKQKSINGNEFIGDVTLHQSKEFLDALEVFDVNKELFQKILQDPDSALAHHFHGLQVSKAKLGLTKSGSFPVPDPSGRRSVRSPKLKHKQMEIGSLVKREEKLEAGSSTPKLAASRSSGDIYAKSVALMAGNTVGGIPKPDQGSSGSADDSSLDSPRQLKNRGENQVVIKRFKDIKQRIKHAIRESRKESHWISMDAIFHRVPYGRRFYKDMKKEMVDQWKEPAMDRDGKDTPRSSYESDGIISALGKGGIYGIKRTSSLNDSLDRYCRLFESSFSKDAKWNLSERLKLTNEDGLLPGGHAPKSLGRILSLPDLESYCSLESEVSRDALCSGMPTGTVVESNVNIECCISADQKRVCIAENRAQLDALVESESRENLEEVSEIIPVIEGQVGSVSDTDDAENAKLDGTSGDWDDLTTGESTSNQEQDIRPTEDDSNKLGQPSPISVLNSCFQEDITSPANFSVSGGSELKPRCIYFDELNSLENFQNQSTMDFSTGAGSTLNLEKVEISSQNVDSEFLHVQVDRRDEADFNYVRDVLQLSGFSGNECLRTWHSLDPQVDTSIFEEVEGCLPLEGDCSRHEDDGSCDHQLLFGLINEILLEIYERSFTYCPRPLSFKSHIRPLPMGYHVLEEVWESISWYMSARPEVDESLDYVVARDLAKGDGWMNLQFETECVGLELEELIFDDLLEEVICS